MMARMMARTITAADDDITTNLCLDAFLAWRGESFENDDNIPVNQRCATAAGACAWTMMARMTARTMAADDDTTTNLWLDAFLAWRGEF